MLSIDFGPSGDVDIANKPDVKKTYRGEWSVFVEFAGWMLKSNTGCLTTCCADHETMDNSLARLVGSKVTAFCINSEGHIELTTSAALSLELIDLDAEDSDAADDPMWAIFRKKHWSIGINRAGDYSLEFGTSPQRTTT